MSVFPKELAFINAVDPFYADQEKKIIMETPFMIILVYIILAYIHLTGMCTLNYRCTMILLQIFNVALTK